MDVCVFKVQENIGEKKTPPHIFYLNFFNHPQKYKKIGGGGERNQDERRFDFHGLGAALKRAREEKGWTQAYVAELVDRDSRTIMNIENKGQYPSFDLFVKLITMFDVSVDQFIHADGGARSSSCRKHIDVLLNSMNEKELVVIEATAEGIKKARETEVPE